MSSIPDNACILGTQEGTSIRLSAARAKYSKAIHLSGGSSEDIIMPEEINLVTFYASTSFTIVYINEDVPAVAGWDAGAFRGIPGIFYDLFVPKNVRILGGGNGSLVMNCLVRWAAISNEGKYTAS